MTAIDIRGPVGPHELHARNYPQEISTLCTATKHGNRAAKIKGCICPAALADWSRYEKRLRYEHKHGIYRRIDITGTRRRLQALCTIGYSQPELARLLSTSQQHVWQHLAGQRSRTVTRRTASRVKTLYDQRSMVPSISPRAARVRKWALEKGWLPPLAWDDSVIDDPAFDPYLLRKFISDHGKSAQPVDVHTDVHIDPIAVERAIHGDPTVTLTRTEKTIALQQLLAAGHTKTEAARRLRLSGRTVNELAAAVTDGAQTVKRFGDLVSSPSSTAEEAS